jgi:outer membrane receptor protein involved in Fe transport
MAQSDRQEADSDGPRIEEITVTAQRRSENLQTVPVSVQVVTSEVLSTRNINSLVSLTAEVPSIHIGYSGRTNELYIRGIGSGTNQSFDQAVGVFIDDIYHGRSRISSGTFLDLERVEVLKGPQSTFFGNNAIAGALNIVTRKPGDETEGSFRALYGQHGRYAVEAAAGTPISEKVGVRLAFIASGVDGWITNVLSNEKLPNENNLAGRLTLSYAASEAFDAVLKVETARNRSRPARQLIGCPQPAPFVASGQCATSIARGYPTGIENNLNAETSNGGYGNLDTTDVVLNMNLDIGGGNTLTSTTGYYTYDWSTLFPGLLDNGLNVLAPEEYEQFSQELRLTSDTGGKFEYMLGAYYQWSHLDSTQLQTNSFLNGTINAAPPFAALRPFLPLALKTNAQWRENNWSVFGTVSYELTESLKLTGGLRYSSVSKDFTWDTFFGQGVASSDQITALPANLQPLAGGLRLGTAGNLANSRKDTELQPSVRLQYDVVPGTMVYASYVHGFKAGGFNGFDLTANPLNYPYDPEKVDAYEVGIKARLLDRRLALNLAYSRSDYKNLQVASGLNSTGALQNVVRNAASARVDAVEFEARLAATRYLNIGLNIDYLKSRYLNYTAAPVTSLQQFRGQTLQDLSGKPTMFAPEWSGSLSIRQEVPVGASKLEFELTPRYSSGYFLTSTIDAGAYQDDYLRLDARITFTLPGDRLSFDIIGKNLTDETILLYAGTSPLTLGSYVATKEQPRNVAFQMRYSF